MPLTPTDVANKQFRIAFRGYSLDEVDAFLDEVETELSRLLRDNASLKDRPPGATPAPAPAVAAAPAAAPPPSMPSMEGQEAALRTLLLAQRTADEAIAEARAEAEDIVARARAEADAALESARNEAESTLSSSKDKAARIDQDVAQRIQAATGDLDERRRALESRIEELRSFEREYRTRLKAYLENQLRDLTSGSGPDDGGAGVPASARSAAVGLTTGGAAGVRQGPAPVPGRGTGEAPGAGDQSADGPPREAGAPSTLRAVPPLNAGAEAVGPFTVVPGTEPSGDRGPDVPTDR